MIPMITQNCSSSIDPERGGGEVDEEEWGNDGQPFLPDHHPIPLWPQRQ